MARVSKRTPEVLEVVLSRIQKGEYERCPLPSTRELAEELGVSKFTIHRAYREAEKRGHIKLSERSRFVTTKSPSPVLKVAYIVPAVDSPSNFLWFSSLDTVVTRRGGHATLVDYDGPNDSRLTQALLEDYNLVFISPPPITQLPSILKRILSKAHERVVTLFQDMPELSILGIDNMPVKAVDLLIYHLVSRGAREIHLVGSQALNGRQKQLVECWASRLASVEAWGEKFFPEVDDKEEFPRAASLQTRELLARFPKPASIIFADLPAALGGCRALWNAGLHPGRDILVAVLSCEPEATYLTPSLTSLIAPSRISMLEETIDQILTKKKDERRRWAERALSRVRLFEGESTNMTARQSISP